MRLSFRNQIISLVLLLQSNDLLSSAIAVSPRVPRSIDAPANASQTFDYVVVGGGAAGLVLANRLTENSDVTVAVIEAGTWAEKYAGNLTEVPAYAGKLPYVEAINWGFETTVQSAMENRTFDYTRAKALGGCSVINFMAFGRTTIGAHARWAKEVGDDSYLYDNMVQYYDKTMNYSTPNTATRLANATTSFDIAEVSTDGELHVTYAAWVQAWSTWASKGLAAIGVPLVETFIDGNLMGHAWQMTTIKVDDSSRSDAETAYLNPILSRPNLFVFDNTLAERVIFSSNKTATGVEVTSSIANVTYTLSAAKEVIVSGGVFQSPQLLMVSGVGPKATLEKYGIDVVSDLPGVGQGMHDHLTSFVEYQVDVVTNSALLDANYSAEAIVEWNTNGQGALASAGGDLSGNEKIPDDLRASFSNDTLAWLNEFPEDWPDVQYNVYPSGVSQVYDGNNYGLLQATLVTPKSRGSVSIQSSSMSDAPLIDGKWLSDPVDVEILTAGFKRVRQALNSSAMAPVLIGDERLPGSSISTDEQIEEYLRSSSSPLYHAFATNKMGQSSDPDAVVDSSGKVFGVNRLRVIDCSAFPFLPAGPAPQIQVYMLAEKLADNIKSEQY